MAFNFDEILNSVYGGFQPGIDGLFTLYQHHISYQNEAVEKAKEAVENYGLFKVPQAGKRAVRKKASQRKSSLLQINGTTRYSTRSREPIKEDDSTTISGEGVQSSSGKASGPPAETLLSSSGAEEDNVMLVSDEHGHSAHRKSTAPTRSSLKSSSGSSEKENEPELGPSIQKVQEKSQRSQGKHPSNVLESSEAEKTPARGVLKTPFQARERLRQAVASPAKGSAGKSRQLFSPYGKYSTRVKALAFEQKLVISPSVTDATTHQPEVVVVLEPELRAACEEDGKEMKEQPGASATATAGVHATSSISGGALNGNDAIIPYDGTDVASAQTEEYSSAKDCRKAVNIKKVKNRCPSVVRATPSKHLGPMRKHSGSRTSTGNTTPKIGGMGLRNAANSFRRVSRQLLRSHKSPAEQHRKPSDSSQEREVARKQEYMKLKSEETKKKRESRAARVRAAKQKQEQKRLQEEKLREMKVQQQDMKRLEKRKEFHKRTQSEREREMGVRSHPVKRKGASPDVRQAKRVQQGVSRTNGINGQENSFEASRLVFFEPSTCLSNKAKLNNSLQQQAMLNSLSQSLRSEPPDHATYDAAVEPSHDLPKPVLDRTYQAGLVLDSTYTVEAHEEEANIPKTPVANSTFVKPPAQSSGYDITPHHSELPPQPNNNPDNYNIEDLQSGDDTDEEDRPRKEVPLWARSHMLHKYIRRQAHKTWEPDHIFGELEDVDMYKVFPVHKKYFKKRTSSAIWTSPVAKST